MFGIKKKPAHIYSSTDMLFGNLPLSYLAAIDSKELPWKLFKKVNEYLAKDDRQEAIRTLKEIIGMPDLESRQYLQAYYFLNELQGFIETEIKILGVIVEISMPGGLDTLAVYADHSARYYNYTGKSVIWQGNDSSLDTLIDDIFIQGKYIVSQVGLWKTQRPDAPGRQMARLNFLTSHGLHFGEAGQRQMFRDPVAGKTMYAMLGVMQELTFKTFQPEKLRA